MSNINYSFDIEMVSGQKRYFTSMNDNFMHNNISYIKNSSLYLHNLQANDSGDNIAIIKGIYNSTGISDQDDLSDAKIMINIIIGDKLQLMGNFICVNYVKHDLAFEIHCNSEIIKYHQPLLKIFSKTCRANFGDDKCKVDISQYIVESSIVSIEDNRVICKNIFDPKQNFSAGKAFLIDDSDKVLMICKINSHINNMLELDLPQNIQKLEAKKIKLVPRCDKKYRTCCYSFNNAVNFRGEPDIPELNVIKN